VYPEPSWRVFGDVDLLVSSDGFSAAAGLLEEYCAVDRAQPELSPGFDARFGKEVLLISPDGLELDLHRTFLEGAMGVTVHLSDLFEAPQPFELGGQVLGTLPPPQQLMHATYTAVLGDSPPRLSALRDVAQVVTTLDPAPAAVLEVARRWRAQAVLARGLTAAWDVLTPAARPPLVDWARSYRPTHLERLLLASHLGPARAYTRHAAALLVVPGLSRRLAYLRAITWPQRPYLERRGFTRRQFAARGLARLHRRAKSP